MECSMNKTDFKKQLEEIQAEMEIKNIKSNMDRARSITVGTAFGGTTEITMRGDGGAYLYSIMQPVEVIELIHQLAANVGCHINLQPRNDFSSWRGWKVPENNLLGHNVQNPMLNGSGHPPFSNDMAPHNKTGRILPSPDKQPELKIKKTIKEQEHAMATKKTINQRSTKRATKTS